MEHMVKYIIGALIVLVLVSVLTPIGINMIHNTSTTGWTSSESTVYSILGVLTLVGVLIGIVYMAIKAK